MHRGSNIRVVQIAVSHVKLFLVSGKRKERQAKAGVMGSLEHCLSAKQCTFLAVRFYHRPLSRTGLSLCRILIGTDSIERDRRQSGTCTLVPCCVFVTQHQNLCSPMLTVTFIHDYSFNN